MTRTILRALGDRGGVAVLASEVGDQRLGVVAVLHLQEVRRFSFRFDAQVSKCVGRPERVFAIDAHGLEARRVAARVEEAHEVGADVLQ
jgi:hypothetical protein